VGILFSRKWSWMRLNSNFYSWNEKGSRKTTESFLLEAQRMLKQYTGL
jgi:hypothetical protein